MRLIPFLLAFVCQLTLAATPKERLNDWLKTVIKVSSQSPISFCSLEFTNLGWSTGTNPIFQVEAEAYIDLANGMRQYTGHNCVRYHWDFSFAKTDSGKTLLTHRIEGVLKGDILLAVKNVVAGLDNGTPVRFSAPPPKISGYHVLGNLLVDLGRWVQAGVIEEIDKGNAVPIGAVGIVGVIDDFIQTGGQLPYSALIPFSNVSAQKMGATTFSLDKGTLETRDVGRGVIGHFDRNAANFSDAKLDALLTAIESDSALAAAVTALVEQGVDILTFLLSGSPKLGPDKFSLLSAKLLDTTNCYKAIVASLQSVP